MNKSKILNCLVPPIARDNIIKMRNMFGYIKYKSLVLRNKAFQNMHKNKKCFILGSAPSILKYDLKPLKQHYVITLNNFFVYSDYEEIMASEDINSKYHIVAPIHPPQTEEEWKNFFKDMEEKVPKNVNIFLGLNLYKYNAEYIINKYSILKKHRLYWYYAGIPVSECYRFNKKHIDFSKIIWSASTVSTYGILLAIFLGFKEIYLLGIDHNYICLKEENYRFYKDSYHQKDEHKRMCLSKRLEFLGTYKVFLEKELIQQNVKNNKIVNCSMDSLLDMFPKSDYNKVIHTKCI